jgi:antitoxin (DNA-binding transcriptional repressor) of toxin-antitoxin stability system
METIPIHKAKSTLSQLVKRAAAGEAIYIGGYGKAEAVLLAADSIKKKSPLIEALGCMKGKIHMADDFDAPLPRELLEAFGYTVEKPESGEEKVPTE